jgi:phage-related protein
MTSDSPYLPCYQTVDYPTSNSGGAPLYVSSMTWNHGHKIPGGILLTDETYRSNIAWLHGFIAPYKSNEMGYSFPLALDHPDTFVEAPSDDDFDTFSDCSDRTEIDSAIFVA